MDSLVPFLIRRSRLGVVALLVATATLVPVVSILPAEPAAAATAAPAVDDPTFEAIAQHGELTSEHATVFRLYWAFFTREPDPGGALYWIGRRDACVGLDVIADHFAASQEFTLRYGDLDDRAFVELIYHHVLERGADPEGLAYWTGLLASGELHRGGVVLYVSQSSEFVARHPYPSDGVPARSCHLPDGRATDRSVDATHGRPLLTVAGMTLLAPAPVVERAGFHESSHPGALVLDAAPGAVARFTTLPSRGRGTPARSAADIVTDPRAVIAAPVAGTVLRSGGYRLYCKYRDEFVVIRPDARPDLEVKVLHLTGVTVRPGQRVTAGQPVAAHATTFPFRSQVDSTTAEPSWPHVHVEVVDPSVPRPSSGSC
jgi:biotin carboxyl carrier protein